MAGDEGGLWNSGRSTQRRERRTTSPQKKKKKKEREKKKHVDLVHDELKRDPYEDTDVEVDRRFQES